MFRRSDLLSACTTYDLPPSNVFTVLLYMGLASRINSPFRPLTHARDRFLELQKAMHTEYQPTLTALVELFEALNAQGISQADYLSSGQAIPWR
jgi:hypothetical protein